MEGYYGFIYITTNKVNNKKYIGQKKLDTGSRWKSYLGSGVHLRKAIEKYGVENFEREIVYFAKDKEDLNNAEMKYIENLNAVDSNEFYNLIEGGSSYEELVKHNSVPVVNIDTGYVFESIMDASRWAGISEATVRSSFKYMHNIEDKVQEVIFKRLSVVRFNHKLCRCCAKNIPLKNKNNCCDKCMSHPNFKPKEYNRFVLKRTTECHDIDELWVKNLTKENRTYKGAYKVLTKEYRIKNRSKIVGKTTKKLEKV